MIQELLRAFILKETFFLGQLLSEKEAGHKRRHLPPRNGVAAVMIMRDQTIFKNYDKNDCRGSEVKHNSFEGDHCDITFEGKDELRCCSETVNERREMYAEI